MESSINRTELNKFQKSADVWWDQSGEFAMLHKINPVRLEYIINVINHHFGIKNSLKSYNNLSLIDIGCGGGLLSVPLYKSGLQVTGLDATEENIVAAREYIKKNNFDINLYAEEVSQHVKRDIKYDVVLCLEVIEHVENLQDFMNQLTKLVKPGGMMIISTLNRTMKSYALAIVMAEYILKWIPTKTHEYSKFVKPSEIANYLSIITKNHLTIQNLQGMSYNILENQWQLSNDIAVNYFAYISAMTKK